MFAVWFSTEHSKQSIVGVSKDKNTAYRMAKDLYSIKKCIDKNNEISTGVFLMDDGTLYTSTKAPSAQVLPLLTSLN